jgi:hypothetical protein
VAASWVAFQTCAKVHKHRLDGAKYSDRTGVGHDRISPWQFHSDHKRTGALELRLSDVELRCVLGARAWLALICTTVLAINRTRIYGIREADNCETLDKRAGHLVALHDCLYLSLQDLQS